MQQNTLLEPSFADVVVAIETATDLPASTRSHWLCSLRQIAKAMDKPLESIQARWTAARFAIGRLHHARVGANAKTLANHKSNVRAALQWFGNETELPKRGVPLDPAWEVLRGRIADRRARAGLSSLMRYCSARRIAPDAVDEGVLDGYMKYRAETTALACNAAARRAIARAWNGCIGVVEGWPSLRLVEPPRVGGPDLAWDDFPEGLRNEIEAYLDTLNTIRRSANNKRLRPCKASTIRTRRAELVASARTAVRIGIHIESLTSLTALLDPDVVERVIDAYWTEDGLEPAKYTIDLGWKLLSVARQTACLGSKELARLDDLRASLEQHRRKGLTEKNRIVIRQVLSGTVWRDVLNLPDAMMEEARSVRDHAPVKAAVMAQIAVAIAILSIAPVRLGNLINIRLDENLIKPGGPAYPYLLVFPDYDVKNRVALELPLNAEVTKLIDEYVHHFRPALVRGSNEPWLFPGETRAAKDGRTLSAQITQRVEKATGLRITPHQFRHAAAAIILKHRPGEYEFVRRVLGHRNIQTTISFYCGLETLQANRVFGEMVRKEMFSEDPPTGGHARGSRAMSGSRKLRNATNDRSPPRKVLRNGRQRQRKVAGR